MILTDKELKAAICFAKSKWNSEADHMNQWCDMGGQEQCELSGRAVESAVLAKLADKLMDVERLDWLKKKLFVSHWNGVIDGGSQTNWSIASDFRHTTQKMVGHTLRDAIDAAMPASKAVKP